MVIVHAYIHLTYIGRYRVIHTGKYVLERVGTQNEKEEKEGSLPLISPPVTMVDLQSLPLPWILVLSPIGSRSDLSILMIFQEINLGWICTEHLPAYPTEQRKWI